MRRKPEVVKGPYVTKIRLDRAKIESFDPFPFCLPIVREFDTLELHPSVTFLVGPNGSGKSTLLEAVAVSMGFNAEGGSRNFNFATHESHSNLNDFLSVAKTPSRPKDGFFLRAESYYNVASEIERLDKSGGGPPLIDSYGGKSLHVQSHGESFLALFQHRLSNGFYILDEPESALSPDGLLSLIAQLHRLVSDGAQFLIATHSPILLTYPNAEVYEIQGGKLALTPFDQTRHFLLTRSLLNRPDIVAKEICGTGRKKRP